MIPITVVAGYLGAGKTHLINRLLASSPEPIGVCVNDFGELNIDAKLIRNRNGTNIELTNGCVCCQLTDDLGFALQELSSQALTRVVVEASGVALPQKIAAYGHNWPGYRLHKTYTLVDASNINRWLTDKYVRELVAAQIQQADEVLVTKLDLLAQESTRSWPWTRTESVTWQVLPNGALGDQEVQRLLNSERMAAPGQGAALAAEQAVTQAGGHQQHHANIAATCVAGTNSIDELVLADFLQVNPHVVRAKGWFVNSTGTRCLLQHVGGVTQIVHDDTTGSAEVAGQSAVQATGLVFLHHASQSLDLAPLA